MSIKYGILLTIVTLMIHTIPYFSWKFFPIYNSIINYPVITKTLLIKNINKWKIIQQNYQLITDYQQTQLNLIYAYYKLNRLTLVQKIIKNIFWGSNFILPQDYILYMQGLTNLQIDYLNKIHFLRINRYDRDQEYAQRALQCFVNLIMTYPNSKYIITAQKYIILLQNSFSKNELLIVKLNFLNGSYISAIKHIKNMIITYPFTKYTHQALILMKNISQNNILL